MCCRRCCCWPLLNWLSVGIYIVAHDAMHGSLCPANRAAGDMIGALAVWLYAGFTFRRLVPKHHAHHRSPGSADDPDFAMRRPNAQQMVRPVHESLFRAARNARHGAAGRASTCCSAHRLEISCCSSQCPACCLRSSCSTSALSCRTGTCRQGGIRFRRPPPDPQQRLWHPDVAADLLSFRLPP